MRGPWRGHPVPVLKDRRRTPSTPGSRAWCTAWSKARTRGTRAAGRRAPRRTGALREARCRCSRPQPASWSRSGPAPSSLAPQRARGLRLRQRPRAQRRPRRLWRWALLRRRQLSRRGADGRPAAAGRADPRPSGVSRIVEIPQGAAHLRRAARVVEDSWRAREGVHQRSGDPLSRTATRTGAAGVDGCSAGGADFARPGMFAPPSTPVRDTVPRIADQTPSGSSRPPPAALQARPGRCGDGANPWQKHLVTRSILRPAPRAGLTLR